MGIKVIETGPELDPDEVKKAIDLRSFLAPGEAVSGNRPLVMFCRWHADTRTPNMYVYHDHVHCFACGKHADLFELLEQEHPGISFPDIVKLAADGAGFTSPIVEFDRGGHAKSTVAIEKLVKAPPPMDPELAEKFHRKLGDKRRWFSDRGLSDALIDSEKLGHNGRAFTIPVWARDGKLLTIRFRRDDSVSQKGPKYWGMEGFNDVLLFNAKALDFGGDTVFVAEGELDSLKLWDECLPAVSATNGARAFNADLAAELWQFKWKVICYDSDEAGRENAARVAAFFPGSAKCLDLSPHKDVTDWFRENEIGEFLAKVETSGAAGVSAHWGSTLRGGFWK